MTVTGYITCFRGRLTAASTIVIEGAEWPVPERAGWTGVDPQPRIVACLGLAGYRPEAPSLLESLSRVDDAGGYEIRLVKL